MTYTPPAYRYSITESRFILTIVLLVIIIHFDTLASAQPLSNPKVNQLAYRRSVSAQEAVQKYSTAQKRLLAINTALFINDITQSSLDADSIQLVALRITGMPFLLSFTDRVEGDNLSATARQINSNHLNAAKKLSEELKGEDQIRSLVDLAIWYLHQPKAFRRDLDSADRYIQKADKLSSARGLEKWHEEILLIMGELQYQRGNIGESRKYFLKIISPASLGTEPAVVAAAFQHISKTFGSQDTARLYHLQRSVAIYHRLHLVENEITISWLMADYHRASHPDLAEGIFKQILALQRSSGFRHELFTQYLLSAMYNYNSKLPEALKAAFAGLENMQWSGLIQFTGCFNMRVGVVYSGIDKLPLALPWFRKGIAIKTDETHFFWYKSFLYLSMGLFHMGKPQECLSLIDSTVNKYRPKTLWESIQVLSTQAVCYDQLHKTTLADLYYQKILAAVKNYHDPYGELAETYADAALFYIRANNAAMARSFLTKTNENSSTDVLFNSLKFNVLYKIDSLEGNYKAALEHHTSYQQAKDSLAAYDQQQKLNELTVKYAAEKKDQDIKLLLERQRVQQSELQNSKLMMGAGGGVLALLLAVAAYRYRLKQRTNEQIAHKNESLQHLLTEKEWLLKEVHHRVKNNLHTVICLLESQARYLENDALAAIENSQHRIFAMSLIHQKLYQSDDIKTIDMATYIPELVQSLEDSFDTSGQIRFNLDIEPINLSLSHAIPLGLIINEAVTNSIKYAFPGYIKGEISISMTSQGGQTILELADNGVGMPEIDFDTEMESLGLRLIQGLSEDIDAETSFKVDNGTRIIITFQSDMLNAPESFIKSTKTTEVSL